MSVQEHIALLQKIRLLLILVLCISATIVYRQFDIEKGHENRVLSRFHGNHTYTMTSRDPSEDRSYASDDTPYIVSAHSSE